MERERNEEGKWGEKERERGRESMEMVREWCQEEYTQTTRALVDKSPKKQVVSKNTAQVMD